MNVSTYWAADFETTTTEEDCRVWAFATASLKNPDDCIIGQTIEEWFNYLCNSNAQYVYFHNLKFDGNFILSFLFQIGYKWTPDRQPGAYEFTTLISDMGMWYNIKIGLPFNDYGYSRIVEIRDSLKIIPLSIEEVPAAFGLAEQKLSIDYKEAREVGHVLTDQEREYVAHDVIILAKAVKQMLEGGQRKLTSGSNALWSYRKMTENFNKWFPKLSQEIDRDIRLSYKGGWTYVNPKWQHQDIGAGRVYDVNSMYPWAMKYCLLPYGEPVRFEGKYEPNPLYPLYVVSFECDFHLKPGHYPSIQLKGNSLYGETEYITDSSELESPTLHLTSVDLELLYENYNVSHIIWEGGYMFKGRTGMFADYVDYWFAEKTHNKEIGNAGKTLIAKLMLNSLYGKFGTRLTGHSKIPYYGEDGKVHFTKSELEDHDGVYIPVATFITSYCRDKIIRGANQVGERFIYADTDSLHIQGDYDPDGLDIDKYRLGAFDHETTFKRARFLRQKTYLEIKGAVDEEGVPIEKKIVKCAGMPKKIKDMVTEANFVEGMVFDGKLLPKVVPGGVILRETTFEIKKLKAKT